MGGLEEEDNIPVAWRIYEGVSPKVVERSKEMWFRKAQCNVCVINDINMERSKIKETIEEWMRFIKN